MAYTNEKSVTVMGGIGFLDALFLVFLVLKLAKVIDWSWWWITAPLWGQVALLIVTLIVVLFVLIVFRMIDKNSDRKVWGKN